MEIIPPHDKWKLVFLTFTLNGLGILMPWNMFITAKEYFVDFKLDVSYTGVQTNYATYFLDYICLAAQVPNLIFNWLNVFVHLGGDISKRIVCCILIEICVFMVTVVLAMCDSSSWPDVFFWITMLSVVVLNMANGIYRNNVFGMVAILPRRYTGGVILGFNISGLFVTIVSISSSAIFSSCRTAAIYYFIAAMFFLLVCLDTFFALPLNRYYRYNELMREKESNQIDDGRKPPYWLIFKQTFPQAFNAFFVLFVTIAVFPAMHSDIKQSDKNFIISAKHFTVVTCFLTFNLFAMLGSLLAYWVQWPDPEYLFIPVLLRSVFVPLLLFCNYHPKNVVRSLPVLIKNDWVYWIIAVIMSCTHGYLSSLGMMYAPQSVARIHQRIAGMFASAMLVTGICTGILSSVTFPIIVTLRYYFIKTLTHITKTDKITTSIYVGLKIT